MGCLLDFLGTKTRWRICSCDLRGVDRKMDSPLHDRHCLFFSFLLSRRREREQGPVEYKSRPNRRAWTAKKGNSARSRDSDSDSDFRPPCKFRHCKLYVRQRLSHLRAIVMDHPAPSPDDTEDLLLSCRYGDIDDVRSFIDRFGTAPVGDVRDENGNNVLHMASANGHIGESNRAPRTHAHAHARSTARLKL